MTAKRAAIVHLLSISLRYFDVATIRVFAYGQFGFPYQRIKNAVRGFVFMLKVLSCRIGE
jgi:hypothetical protein